jgi:hypothetical protein
MGVRGAYYDYHNLSIRDAAILADLGNGGDAIEQNPLFSELPPLSTCQIDEQTGARSDGCFFQRARAAGRVQQAVVDLYMRFRPFGEDWPITPFVQYTTLTSAMTEPDGWGFGVQIGTPEILELRAMWAQLERNSTVALFTDSDLFDGFTNAKGWHVSLARKLSPNVTLRLTYYSAQVNEEMCLAIEEKGRPALFCDAATAQALNTAFDFRRASLDHRKRIQIDLTAEF